MVAVYEPCWFFFFLIWVWMSSVS